MHLGSDLLDRGEHEHLVRMTCPMSWVNRLLTVDVRSSMKWVVNYHDLVLSYAGDPVWGQASTDPPHFDLLPTLDQEFYVTWRWTTAELASASATSTWGMGLPQRRPVFVMTTLGRLRFRTDEAMESAWLPRYHWASLLLGHSNPNQK